MPLQRWGLAGLLGIAGLALWWLLAGPSQVLGIDTGQAGTALLVTVAWVSLYAVRRLPRGAHEKAIAPGEWKAWIGVAFMAVAIAYLVSKLHVLQGAAIPHNPAAAAVGRNLVLLLVAWTVLAGVLAARWKGEVEDDERDRAIARHAGDWGRATLTVAIVGIAVMLACSPPHKLQWATHLLIANLLILALMCACLAGHAASVVYYWRDRR